MNAIAFGSSMYLLTPDTASISRKGRVCYLGTYETPGDAAEVYSMPSENTQVFNYY